MKKLLVTIAVLGLAIAPAFAQLSYEKGDNVVQVGVGFGLAGLYGDADLPPITLAFDHGIADKISIGGIVGYSSSKQSIPIFFGTPLEWKYTYIIVGARGAYHFIEDSKNLDAYAGVTLGYNIVSAKLSGGNAPFGFGASGSYMLYGGYVGARYYFSESFGIYGEAGYGVGYINAGIALKL